MQVHTDITRLPQFKNAVVTIGTFDGVHSGHCQIIAALKKEADRVNGETVIITFYPHPRKVVSSTILGIRLLNTFDEKVALLETMAIDHLVVVPFTEAFANIPAVDYIKDFLVRLFQPQTIIIGYDHRFGRDRKGDFLLLETLAPKYGYALQEISKHVLEEVGISSTKIREAILAGNFEMVNQLLGYQFFFSGKVVHGDKLGRQLGYPTANIEIQDEEKIIPCNGIYAVYASLLKREDTLFKPSLKGMMSVGFRPTVDGKKRVIEVNLFDFKEEIYDEQIRIYVVKYLREEVKFDSLEALVKQIDKDKVDSLAIL